MFPEPIQRLVALFSKFPTIGQRTATRFVFYLLKLPQSDIEELANALVNLKKQIKLCLFCFNPFDSTGLDKEIKLCLICRGKTRTSPLLCVVEKESDLEALEKAQSYNGLYFILGGTVGMLKKEDMKRLRLQELKERLENPRNFGISQEKFNELIIATNPTVEGEATALYLERLAQSLKILSTRLGRGLPIGGEIEYADEETLRNALEGRR